jgi:multidrug efflux system membrane fusion protein
MEADDLNIPQAGWLAPSRDAQQIREAGTRVSTAPKFWPMWIARAVVSLVLIAASLFGAQSLKGYLVASKPATPVQTMPERIRTVDVVISKSGTVQPLLTAYGQIAAGRSVDLRMLVAGEVMAISPNLIEGGRVTVGESLVTIDSFEYEGAKIQTATELSEAELRIVETQARIGLERAAMKRADEQKKIAIREVERLSTLEGSGAVSTAVLDASRTRLSAAEAAFEARASQISVLEAQLNRERTSLDRLKWSVRKAERDLQNTVLKAPFEGIVSNASAEDGRLLNVNDRIATLIDPDRFEVLFSLSDAQYARLVRDGGTFTGREVTIIWSGGDIQFEAKGIVDRVSPVASSVAGAFDVYARLERSRTTEKMRPSAFVAVQMADTLYRDVVRLPQTALHPGNLIFAIGDDDRLIEIPVTVAGFDDNAVLVRGPVPDGARVMASRLPDAGPGILVKPRLNDDRASEAGP